MGYSPPSGRPLILPAGVTWQPIARAIDAGIVSTNEARALFGVPAGLARPGLPLTFAEYRAQLYGRPRRDWFPVLNSGLLAGMVALVAAVASWAAR